MGNVSTSKDIDMSGRGLTLTLSHANSLTNKVAAIKAHREFTGAGLKESKEFIESVRPGAFTSVFPTYSILKPQFDEIVERLQMSGLTVNVIHENNAVRKAIGEQVRQLATFATLGAQYDLAKSLIDVAEAHCVCADPNFDIDKAIASLEDDDAD